MGDARAYPGATVDLDAELCRVEDVLKAREMFPQGWYSGGGWHFRGIDLPGDATALTGMLPLTLSVAEPVGSDLPERAALRPACRLVGADRLDGTQLARGTRTRPRTRARTNRCAGVLQQRRQPRTGSSTTPCTHTSTPLRENEPSTSPGRSDTTSSGPANTAGSPSPEASPGGDRKHCNPPATIWRIRWSPAPLGAGVEPTLRARGAGAER